MPFNPTQGEVAILKIGTTTVPGVNWTLALDGKLKDVSNFRDGRAKQGTLPDGTLSFTLVWDSAEQPTKAADANIRLGVAATAQCYTDATHFFQVPVMFGKVTPKNGGVEDVLMYDVEAELNGAITYPLDT